jgi:hypothetical protein
MHSKLNKTMLAVVIATSLMTSSAVGQERIEDAISSLDCFTRDEIRKLSQFKKDCDLCKLDLRSCSSTVDRMSAEPVIPWYKESGVILSGLALAISGGIVIGVYSR